MELDHLFSPGKMGSVEIKNRIVRSATFMNMAEKYGQVGEKHINYYKNLFSSVIEESKSVKDKLLAELEKLEKELFCIQF